MWFLKKSNVSTHFLENCYFIMTFREVRVGSSSAGKKKDDPAVWNHVTRRRPNRGILPLAVGWWGSEQIVLLTPPQRWKVIEIENQTDAEETTCMLRCCPLADSMWNCSLFFWPLQVGQAQSGFNHKTPCSHARWSEANARYICNIRINRTREERRRLQLQLRAEKNSPLFHPISD